MISLYVFCSLINVVDWLQNHLLACPFKSLTGIDCPGCGFQRSFIALVQGDLASSWSFYPSTIPILILFFISGILYCYPMKHQSILLKVMVMVVGNFVIVSYLIKMFFH